MKEKTFEESLNNLKNAADKIKDDKTSIAEALKQFEIGMSEYKYCNEVLKNATQKIEVYEKEVEENDG